MPRSTESLFIADLHLGRDRPELTARFVRFCEQRAANVQRLYILGDLFDAYIGDDDNGSPCREVKQALRFLTQNGVAVYLLRGNRDFLIGSGFFRQTGVQELGDHAVIDLHGSPALVTHGDLLCTDDVRYQAARVRVRNPAWQRQALAKPLWLRRLHARWYRWRSHLHKRQTGNDIMDVNQQAVAATLQQFGVTRLIHGHTHKPAAHDLSVAGQACQRFVLADWDRQPTVLAWDETGYRYEAV